MDRNKKELLMIAVMILVLTIGISYTYFRIKRDLNINDIVSGYINMNFVDNNDQLELGSPIPIYDEEINEKSSYITFDVTNTGNINMYVEMYFKDIEMSNELKSYDFKWRVEDITEDEVKIINEGTFISVKDNKRYLSSNQKIEPGKTRKYKIRVWVHENNKDQGNINSASFKARVAANAYSREIGGVPNEPKLAEGLIPVVYDYEKNVWIKAGGEHYWYDYNNQMWANAVTVGSNASTCNNECDDNEGKHDRAYYLEAQPGTPISIDDINTMWVWIPRYKYRIPSNIGSTEDIAIPPIIDVIFENGTANTGVSEKVYRDSLLKTVTYSKYYYTHPAFINGEKVNNGTPYDIGGWDEELTGIWFGKFITTREDDSDNNISILPNKLHFRYKNISEFFKYTLNFAGGVMNETTGKITFSGNDKYGLSSSSDTHISKNIDWGSVAILSQSRFGKRGNKNYVGNESEVYLNNSSYSLSGRSVGRGEIETSEDSTIYGNYSYNDFKCLDKEFKKCTGEKEENKGTGASTTGTIYGIYDMVGPVVQITMANYNHYVGTITTNSDSAETKVLSGFNGKLSNGTEYNEGIPFPERKYYDLYTKNISTTSPSLDFNIMGDAVYETKKWNNDYEMIVSNSYPFQTRAGFYNYNHANSGNAGVFFSSVYSGSSNQWFSSRAVLIP